MDYLFLHRDKRTFTSERQRNLLFRAAFAWTDTVAIGAMNRLRELGIRVPAQMAVAGYSGTVLSTIVNPQLTTVEQPLDEMGCRAAELILEKIADPSAPDRTVTLTACIRERASTAR